MSDKVQPYLDYLEKEMTIMGVLSAFCLATLSLTLKELFEAKRATQLASILTNNAPLVIIATVIMFVAGGFFYQQRSTLAWLYGQIALSNCDATITDRTMSEWLAIADSWRTWIPYRWGIHSMATALVGYFLALASSQFASETRHQLVVGYIIGVLLAFVASLRMTFVLRAETRESEYPLTLAAMLGYKQDSNRDRK